MTTRVLFICNCSASLPLPFSQNKPQTLLTTATSLNWPQKTLISALTGILSFGLLVSPPSSLALTSLLNDAQNHSTQYYCREEESEERFDTPPESVTNEGIVEEAWEIVNDSFLDTGRHRWSPETWLRKKEDILATSIQTRSKAHDIIQRMLAGLGDPYTRFLSSTEAGIEIAKLFLNEGDTVIYTVGRDAQYQTNIIAETAPLFTAPVVVLVNKNTASASEIVASALHDNCRAVLVGERTFGKGLIQSVFELHDGSGVVVTIGKYVTPNHMDINSNGIEPDFEKFPGWIEVIKHLSKCHRLQEG